jgi:hypothetical protein
VSRRKRPNDDGDAVVEDKDVGVGVGGCSMLNRRMVGSLGLVMIGVAGLFLVSCAPMQAGPEPQYGQQVAPQGPPPGDYAQPVIDQRAEYRRNMAKEARDAAYTFQRQNLVKQAVVKYRESLAWWPDPALDAYVETVERATGLPLSGKRRPWIEAPRAPGKKYETVATIRNRSNRDVYIVTVGGAESPESRFLPGEIREVAVTPNSYGEIVFSASRGGPLLATTTWTGDQEDARVAPVVLFDDNHPDKLLVMTGFRTR